MSLPPSELRELAEMIRKDVFQVTICDYAQKIEEHLVSYRKMVAMRDELWDELDYARNEIPDQFKREDGCVCSSIRTMVAYIAELRMEIREMTEKEFDGGQWDEI